MLATALQTANSGLSSTSEQIAVVSRNVSNTNDADASRKTAVLDTKVGGIVLVARVDRVDNSALLDASLSATSAASAQEVTNAGLQELQATIGDVSSDSSPAALIGTLSAALQTYSANPADDQAGQGVVAAASNVASSLNRAASDVQTVRQGADTQIAAAVNDVNVLLAKFKTLNDEVVSGTRLSSDVTDQLDQRDAIVKSLAADIGIRVTRRSDGDMAIYTDSGVTLFDKIPRNVEYSSKPLSVGSVGGQVRVDGVVIAGSAETMATGAGKIRAYVDLRDKTSVAYGAQVDEMARALISGFAEPDVNSTVPGPDQPGLFIYAQASGGPLPAVLQPGMALQIKVNPSYDPAQGGNANRVRDGGTAGTAYLSNTTGASGYSDRIVSLEKSLTATQAFSPTTELQADQSLQTFSEASVGWLGQKLQDSNSALSFQSALSARATDALSAETGVSLDQEMSNMLQLERSYQASARLITTIDSMFKVLLGGGA